MKRILVLSLMMVVLVGCYFPEEGEVSSESQSSFEDALAFIEENLPAEKYFTNEYLPADVGKVMPKNCEGEVQDVQIGMIWVLNDETAPWFLAKEFGWDKDQCQNWILVPGGPGVNHLQTAAGGAVDIGVSGATEIARINASKTGTHMIAVGAFLKKSPYGWLGIDWELDKSEAHPDPTQVLEPRDFVGKTIALQGGSTHYADYLWSRYHLPGEPNIVEGGFLPDPLLTKNWDYYGAWLVNQPRLLEEQGFNNWVFFLFADHGLGAYTNVSVVRKETLDDDPEMVRGYLAALSQGVDYLLKSPEEAAEITVKYAKEMADIDGAVEQTLRRFELQEPLIRGEDGLPPLHMRAEEFDRLAATMYQFGQLEFD